MRRCRPNRRLRGPGVGDLPADREHPAHHAEERGALGGLWGTRLPRLKHVAEEPPRRTGAPMIDFELDIEAPATTVFGLLTEPDGLARWMVREAEVDLRPGGRFRWVYDNGDIVVGEFVAIEAPHRLSFRYGWEHPADRNIPPDSTLVDVTLSEIAIEGFFPADAATGDVLQRFLPVAAGRRQGGQ